VLRLANKQRFLRDPGYARRVADEIAEYLFGVLQGEYRDVPGSTSRGGPSRRSGDRPAGAPGQPSGATAPAFRSDTCSSIFRLPFHSFTFGVNARQQSPPALSNSSNRSAMFHATHRITVSP
jgi:hypothetical protein